MCFVQNLRKQNSFKPVADTKPFHSIDNNLFWMKYVGGKPFFTLRKNKQQLKQYFMFGVPNDELYFQTSWFEVYGFIHHFEIDFGGNFKKSIPI